MILTHYQTINTLNITSFMQHCSQRCNQTLEGKVDSIPNVSSLREAMLYSITNGGKRFRPTLLYATLEALNTPLATGDDLASAVECIHTYSLIHDDLPAMDDDALRRGKPTCHVQFNEATAILAGDALQTLAFDIIAESEVLTDQQKVSAIQVLARASGPSGMVGGQSHDLASEGKNIDQQELESIHHKKTGVLISACTEMAAIAANASPQTRSALQEFSLTLGLAFQVADDILDITSSTEMLGKQQGADHELDKATYPKFLGLEGAQQYLADLHQKALSLLDKATLDKKETLVELTNFVVHRRY
ncbi:(2E,6E)-farnesyl diphosphate synthase [Litoribacillus peritrichatus]|uniref:(2E,6E)-farnesyl diphosphate synthase n=2 Tax=Litoribacillus peritrichatus TaxID=718191 RepID=A0ABP7M212_9GAMM